MIETPDVESDMMDVMDAIDEIDEEVSPSADVYIVSKILKIRQHKGVYQMMVQWKGYSAVTWENVITLHEDVQDIVEDFLDSVKSVQARNVSEMLSSQDEIIEQKECISRLATETESETAKKRTAKKTAKKRTARKTGMDGWMKVDGKWMKMV